MIMLPPALRALSAAFLLSLVHASGHEEVCAAGAGACAADHNALLQAKIKRHEVSAQCPGSSSQCAGSQCCPGTEASGGKTFPCPNADEDFSGCQSTATTTTTVVPGCAAPKKLSDVRGKSIYLILADRFARDSGANQSACESNEPNEENTWCNGTINGIADHLDYIQGMGFDCVWVTPLVGQFQGRDGQSGYAYHGYWAYQWYEIDQHFGTSADLKRLSEELHKRDMCFVYDFVTNHVGPIHSLLNVEKIVPFNKPEYFHTLQIDELANGDFDKYTEKMGGWPPPVQALGPGAQCGSNYPNCNCYKCPYDMGFGTPCNVTVIFDPTSPCPHPDVAAAQTPMTAPNSYCNAGDFWCTGYSELVTREGWFYDLGDLNHSHPFVHNELLRWGRYMVDTYDIDAVRLDTASYQSLEFLHDLQKAVCVPILGEVTVQNMTFHAQIQSDPPTPTGRPVLDGVLNFPLTYAAVPGFCPTTTLMPIAQGNLSFLGQRMTFQIESGLYRDVHTLGNQVDNHDMDRIAKVCDNDRSKMASLIVWNMLVTGAPTIYYGTEAEMVPQRDSFWDYGWKMDRPFYQLLATLNRLRKAENITTAPQKTEYADENQIVFTRGSDKDVWVYLTNTGNGTDIVKYCGDGAVPDEVDGFEWVDALTGKKADICEETAHKAPYGKKVCLNAPSDMPVVLVKKAMHPPIPPCKVGDHVKCSAHGPMCAGNQCCPGSATYACPSASPDFAGCNLPKQANCVSVPAALAELA